MNQMKTKTKWDKLFNMVDLDFGEYPSDNAELFFEKYWILKPFYFIMQAIVGYFFYIAFVFCLFEIKRCIQ